MPPEFRESRRNMLRHEDSLRRVLDRQYLSTELMIRESVLTEIFEYVSAQLYRIKQRKEELTPDTVASSDEQRGQDEEDMESSAKPSDP